MRRWLLFVHRWLGLTLGIIFAIASLTGGILVYEAPLDEWLSGPRFITTEGRVDPAVVEAAARSKWPEGQVIRVDWPTPAANVYRVQARVGRLRENLILDAGSGTELQPRQTNRLLRTARGVHATLSLKSIGTRLVYWATAAALLAIVLGICLWWPGIRSFARGFRVRFRRDAYIFNFDLHQVTGILAMPLLLVMCLSGVLYQHGRVVDAATRMIHGKSAEPVWTDIAPGAGAVEIPTAGPAAIRPDDSPPKSDEGADNTERAVDVAAADLKTVSESALAAAGGGDLMRITIPEVDGAPIEAWIANPPGATAADSLFIALDRATGVPLRRRLGEPRLRIDRTLNNRLHQARVGGPVVHALYAFSCAVGFLLLPTGVTMWWIRRRRKAYAAERRAVATATEEA